LFSGKEGEVSNKIVKYNSSKQTAWNYGQGNNPEGRLLDGQEYEVERVEVHSWHTLYHLKGDIGKYNSVMFDGVLKGDHNES
jgi:hypothetical protein